jgi:hypothetical protein
LTIQNLVFFRSIGKGMSVGLGQTNAPKSNVTYAPCPVRKLVTFSYHNLEIVLRRSSSASLVTDTSRILLASIHGHRQGRTKPDCIVLLRKFQQNRPYPKNICQELGSFNRSFVFFSMDDKCLWSNGQSTK